MYIYAHGKKFKPNKLFRVLRELILGRQRWFNVKKNVIHLISKIKEKMI